MAYLLYEEKGMIQTGEFRDRLGISRKCAIILLERFDREQIGAGVPPGLQNQCGALIPSRMGSIPICSRQKRTQLSILTLLIETGLPAASFVLTLFLHFP